MRNQLLGALLLPALTAAAGAQTYTIKLRTEQDVGKAVTTRNTQRSSGLTKLFDAEGKMLSKQEPEDSGEEVYVETVLEKKEGDRRPRKFKRTYEKAVHGKPGKPVPLSYQGRTVVFELRDGKYEVRAEGQPALDRKDLDMLAAQANDQTAGDLEKAFMPGKPVKAGDSWPVENRLLEETFGKNSKLDLPRSRGEVRLVKAYEKDGKQFGVLELTLHIAYKSMQGLTFDPPGIFEAKMTLDRAIDGSSNAAVSTMDVKLSGKARYEDKGMKFTVEMSTSSSGKVVRSEAR